MAASALYFEHSSTHWFYTGMNVRSMLVPSEIMMMLSSCTAACERRLSCINLQKTSIRTSLSNQLFDDIIRTAIDGVPVQKFKTEDHVNLGIANSKGTRHLEGHKSPSSKKIKL